MAQDLQSIVQRMIAAGESEDNIKTVIQHFKAQAPAEPQVDQGPGAQDQGPVEGPMDLSRIADPGGALALESTARENPGAATAGAAAPFAGLIPGGMIRTAINTVAPFASAASGAYSGGTAGYHRGGVPGAIAGAIGGGIAGYETPRLLGSGVGYLRAATAAKNAEAAAAAAKSAPSIIQEATPGLAQMLSRPGTGQAVQQAEEAALRNQLLHALRSR